MGQICPEKKGNVVVIGLVGSFESPEDESRITAAVKEAIEERPAGILVNYERVTHMTGGNYGVFFRFAIALHKLSESSAVPVKHLIPMGSTVEFLHEQLRITKLDKFIPAFGNEPEALQSFVTSP
jgi:hypothetical protein